MPVIYDEYGFTEPVLGDQVDRLAETLGVAWEERDSDYRGTYFMASGQSFGGGRLVLQANDLRDESGGYLQLPDYPEVRFLLFVNQCDGADDVRARLSALPQWRFLRRRVLD